MKTPCTISGRRATARFTLIELMVDDAGVIAPLHYHLFVNNSRMRKEPSGLSKSRTAVTRWSCFATTRASRRLL
jgi:hypothetical protein